MPTSQSSGIDLKITYNMYKDIPRPPRLIYLHQPSREAPVSSFGFASQFHEKTRVFFSLARTLCISYTSPVVLFLLFFAQEVTVETDWVCQRAHLRSLLHLHPDWSQQQVADAVGCSKSTACTWKKRFAHGIPRSASLLFSRSRAPHHHPDRVAQEVVERIIEMRLSPPELLKRTPGPKALLYSLPHDEAFRQLGLRLPRSTRTIWQILDTASLIERATPRKHAPLPAQERSLH